MNLNKIDEKFIEELVIASKLESSQVLEALTMVDGYITEINLSTVFRKIKKMPCFSSLIRLKTLRLSEDTFAKKKKWLLRKLEIKSSAVSNIEIWVERLTTLTLATPNLLSLKYQAHKLTDLAVEKMTKLTALTLACYGQPFDKWPHEPSNIEKLEVSIPPDRVRDGALFNIHELPKLSNYTSIKYLYISGREVDISLNLDLDNHKDLKRLSLFAGKSVSVIGNPASISVYRLSMHLADTQTLHNFADTYNWDNGILPLENIIRSKQCSEDTAKMIYWLAKPTWYLQYESDEAVPGIHKETLKLIRLIERQFEVNRTFVKMPFKWKDVADHYPELPKLRSIPEYMYSDKLV